MKTAADRHPTAGPPPELPGKSLPADGLRGFAAAARGNRPRRWRRTTQIVFLAICLFIGWRFMQFYEACLGSTHLSAQRPPGVEALLPISALMSARFWLLTGEIHPVHPAGLLIFTAIVAVSLLFKRSFCSWVCPFGLLSEKLADLGGKMIGRNLKVPRWLDLPLRGIKYLLLGFFGYIIFCRLDLASLRAFLESPFNQMADVRLLQFFLHPSTTTLLVVTVLGCLSVVIRHFWCRYLCAYGALTALAGLASPVRIKRDSDTCIDCAKCAKACPASLPVHRLDTIRSDECSLCIECIAACPVPDTLGVKPVGSRRRVGPLVMALGIGGTFLVLFVVGKFSGHWQTSVTPEQTAALIQSTAPAQP